MTYLKRALLALVCLVVLGAGLIALIGYRLSSATSAETDAKLESSQNVRQGKVQNLEPAAGFEFSWASLAEAFAEHLNTEPVDSLPLRPSSAARLSGFVGDRWLTHPHRSGIFGARLAVFFCWASALSSVPVGFGRRAKHRCGGHLA